MVFGLFLSLMACKNDTADYTSIGIPITNEGAKSTTEMSETYHTMNIGDTIIAKMSGKVDEVCQNKGCWMKLNLENGEQVMVKFKDYGFFMPKDIAGKKVIINGKAYINEVTVEEQRHYAEDAGKPADEIAAISEPKETYSFEANGVLLKDL